MSSIKQYIDLYETEREQIFSHGSAPLNKLRPEALKMLQSIRLPRLGDENFANIDMEEMLAPDYGINFQSSRLSIQQSLSTQLPEGVEMGNLREFGRSHPEYVSKFYGTAADIANPIVALNTLFVEDGLFLRVKEGMKVEKALRLDNLLKNSNPEMAIRRLLVVIEKNAECKLLVCSSSQRNDVELMEVETAEIFVGEGGRFDYYHVEETSETTSRLSALYAVQGAKSTLNIDGITLFNGRTRNEYYCRLAGEKARLRLYGMGIEDKDHVLATYSRIDHSVPRCKSDELFKYTVDDQASGAFTGRIYVAPGSVKTEAYQANRNLVGSDSAKMYSRPQLEIYNDDVKCSHGCAIGQLDPQQLFYMRTRGLDEEEARLLLRRAFMQDVIAAVDVPEIHDKLSRLIEDRFRK